MLRPPDLPCLLRLLPAVALCAAFVGAPLLAEDLPPPARVLVDERAARAVSVDPPELTWEAHAKCARVSLTNLTQAPVEVWLQTVCVPGTTENPCGGLAGLTRGFVGVIVLGASEITPDSTVESTHQLPPGEKLVVEHALSPTATTCEVVSTVGLGGPFQSAQARLQEREADRLRQQRQTREDYHRARKEEEARWQELRARLIALRSQCQPFSSEYKAGLSQYWEALQRHKSRIKLLEEEFQTAPDPPSAAPSNGAVGKR